MSETLLFDPVDLEPLLAQGWLALTPNRRLASRIRTAIVQRAASQGRAVVASPAVLSLADWLEQLWSQLCFIDPDSDRYWLLDGDQERALWQRVVEASDAGQLLRPAEAAQQAQAAYRTLALWQQLPLRRVVAAEFDVAEESKTFRDWLDDFERRCEAIGAISPARRDGLLLAAAQADKLVLPNAVVGVAFDELTPLHRALLECVEQRHVLELPSRNRRINAIGCDDFPSQIRRAAQWAKERLQAAPTAPVAIVVPQLAQQRACVERLLRDQFDIDHADPQTPHRTPPFNISAGAALAELPLVAAALDLLGLMRREQSRGALLALLGSPFHGFAEPLDATARALAAICDLRSERISNAQLRTIAASVTEGFTSWSLSSRLQQLHDQARRERLSQLRLTPGQWRAHFESALQLLGWPGARALDSIEYQQLQQWLQVLDDFVRLDVVVGPLGFDAALGALQELLGARPFQPQTADAPLQVLGLLEAAGLQFDGVWLCDMGEDLWPPAAAPNPLLPRSLQQRLAMPHCDPLREQQFAGRLTQSLLAASHEVVVCYQQQRDDVPRRPSPLFGELPMLADVPTREMSSQPSLALELFAPGPAPLLNLDTRARGGSGILASQSACPFQAFARHRLGARALEESVEGLDYSERGQLLHGSLETIWRSLGSRDALEQYDGDALNTLIERAAADAVDHLRLRIPERLGQRFAELERQRLGRLLQAWLELELERPSFDIAALEQSRDLQLGTLNLQLRVDRIDRLADGRQLIIDYKSGRSSTAAWLGARPEQPQLLLYGAALESEQRGSVAGLLFAQIRSDGQKLTGLGDSELDGHGVGTTESPWSQQLDDWRIALLLLADEYVSGRAEVAPSSMRACQNCDLADVCRIGTAVEAKGDDGETVTESSAETIA